MRKKDGKNMEKIRKKYGKNTLKNTLKNGVYLPNYYHSIPTMSFELVRTHYLVYLLVHRVGKVYYSIILLWLQPKLLLKAFKSFCCVLGPNR